MVQPLLMLFLSKFHLSPEDEIAFQFFFVVSGMLLIDFLLRTLWFTFFFLLIFCFRYLISLILLWKLIEHVDLLPPNIKDLQFGRFLKNGKVFPFPPFLNALSPWELSHSFSIHFFAVHFVCYCN